MQESWNIFRLVSAFPLILHSRVGIKIWIWTENLHLPLTESITMITSDYQSILPVQSNENLKLFLSNFSSFSWICETVRKSGPNEDSDSFYRTRKFFQRRFRHDGVEDREHQLHVFPQERSSWIQVFYSIPQSNVFIVQHHLELHKAINQDAGRICVELLKSFWKWKL